MAAKTPRYLVVIADDYGYSVPRDDGIVECFKKGAVTHTSLMVNGISAESGVAKAAKEGLPMGLHLNLTEGTTVGSSSYKTLVGEDGFLLGMFGFREAIKQNRVDMNEVREEIQQQIDKFEKLTGFKPISVDGHQHAHVIPGVDQVFAEVLEANGITITRLPVEEIASHTFITETRAAFMAEVVQQSLQAALVLKAHGIWYPGFTGLKTMGSDMNFGDLQKSILDAYHKLENRSQDRTAVKDKTTVNRQDNICELMTHPGYKTVNEGGCGNGPDEFSQSGEREHEMNILSHENMKSFYEENNIKLISFKDIV